MVKWMRDTTSRSYVRRFEHFAEDDKRNREVYLSDAFESLLQSQGRDSSIVIDDASKHLLRDRLNLDPMFFDMLQHFLAATHTGDLVLPLQLSKSQFHAFMSVTFQRLSFANQKAHFRRLFQMFDEDGNNSINESELHQMSVIRGFHFSNSNMNIMRRRSDQSGELDHAAFAGGLYFVSMENKVKKSRR